MDIATPDEVRKMLKLKGKTRRSCKNIGRGSRGQVQAGEGDGIPQGDGRRRARPKSISLAWNSNLGPSPAFERIAPMSSWQIKVLYYGKIRVRNRA